MASDVEHLFTCLWGNLYVFLEEVSILGPYPFFYGIVCLPGVELYVFFIHFGDQALVQCIIGKYVLPYIWFPFHFDDGFFRHAEAF